MLFKCIYFISTAFVVWGIFLYLCYPAGSIASTDPHVEVDVCDGFTVGNILWNTQRCLSVLTILCFHSFLIFDHWTSQRTFKMSPESPMTPCTYWNNNASWMFLVNHARRFLLLFQPGTCVFPQLFSSIGFTQLPPGWGTTVHAHKLLGLTRFVVMALCPLLRMRRDTYLMFLTETILIIRYFQLRLRYKGAIINYFRVLQEHVAMRVSSLTDHKQCNTRLSLPHSFQTKLFFFLSQGLACVPGCYVQALRTPIGLIFATHPWGSPTGQAPTSAQGLSAPAPWKPQQGRAPHPLCLALPGHGPQHGSSDLPTAKAHWGIRQWYLGSKRHNKVPAQAGRLHLIRFME